MDKHSLTWSLVVAAAILLTACQDRREPVKPTVGPVTQAAQPAR